jgi:acyl dehydratase
MSQNTKNLAPLPAIGTQATLSRTITEDDILLFALVSGDHNPIHLDHDYAERSLFGKRIAHGFLTDCTNQHGTLVLSGEATVKYSKELEAA